MTPDNLNTSTPDNLNTPAATEPDRVVFAGINKWYGEVPAVRELNLSIREGEFLTLLGPSGSGKTTTLRMLAGLEAASSGEILLAGRRVTDEVPEKRNIGLVFQNYALFPHLTVAHNVAFPLRMRRQRKADITRQVDRVLAMTQLTPYRDRYPRQLSGGQQQRVALARAFVFDPNVLLMDEPLGALDRNLRDHMRLELKSLQRRVGATVMYVTHDQDEALALSDRIGVMHHGVLQQTSTPQDIYERPVNSFVARFLGQSMCLAATRIESGRHTVLEVPELGGQVLVSADNDCCAEPTGELMIRPERLRIDESRPDTTERNAVRATVEATVYLGAQIEIHLRTEAGATVQRTVPARSSWPGTDQNRSPSLAPGRPDERWPAGTGDAPAVGATCWLSWTPDDARFLPQVT